ncbi:MAG: universal stress protein [Methanoregulaceae archaeon]
MPAPLWRTLLVAVDGSPITREVLLKATDLALRYDAALHLVYVIQSGWSEGDVTRQLAIRELEEESAAILSEASQEIARKGCTAAIHREQGHPGNTIVELAARINADLIVLGSVGKSQVERMLTGSVSTFVVAHSPVSTLVVKP